MKWHKAQSSSFWDDGYAVPLDGWLDELRKPYADRCVYGVGGLAKPHWERGKPEWFPDEFLWVVGCSYRGLQLTIGPVRNLIGASMSFRKEAFDSAGGFVETMGRLSSKPLGCEETEFSIRLTQANPGVILLFNPWRSKSSITYRNNAVLSATPRGAAGPKDFLRRRSHARVGRVSAFERGTPPCLAGPSAVPSGKESATAVWANRWGITRRSSHCTGPEEPQQVDTALATYTGLSLTVAK